jgi:hypothetical protein
MAGKGRSESAAALASTSAARRVRQIAARTNVVGQAKPYEAAGAVFRHGSDNIEVVTVEQLPVFGRVEARVVERVAFETT